MFSSKTANSLRRFCDCNVSLKRKCYSKARKNSLEIQMISESLRKQIFGNCASNESSANLQKIKEHLSSHGLWKSKPKGKSKKLSDAVAVEDKPMFDTPIQEVVDVKIPSLKGSNVDEHFQNIGDYYSKDYKRLADELIEGSIPKMPKLWNFSEGWTRYETDSNGNVISEQKVAFPSGDALVFDVEVCMSDGAGDRPTMATAVSSKYWYSWCSSRLFENDNFANISFMKTETSAKLSDFIPMGKHLEKERIIVGHNVSYDRSFIKEQYDLKTDKTRFLDTMSIHMAISGLTGYQRTLTRSLDAAKKNGASSYEATKSLMSRGNANPMNWDKVGALNSLVSVYKFYCEKELEKEERDLFVKGSLDDIRQNFQNLMSYCANDVNATFEVFCKEWSTFKERFPHPVTLAGMLEMSVMYLPVNTANWNRYLEESQATYDDMERELALYLQHLANDACRLLNNDDYKKDVWLWDLDWSTKNIRVRKNTAISTVSGANSSPLDNESEDDHVSDFVKQLLNSKKSLMKLQPYLAGYPQWYRDFCENPFGITTTKSPEKMENWEPGPFLISTQIRSVPKLLRLMWKGFALHYDGEEGWGYLVPNHQNIEEQCMGRLVLDELNPEVVKFPFEEYCRLLKTDAVKSDLETNEGDNVIVYTQQEYLKEIRNRGKKPNEEKFKSKFGCKFYRLPHKDGPDYNVGNPLSKEFLRYLDDGNLTTFSSTTADSILKLNKAISYWKMNQKRIYSQLVLPSDSIKNFSSLLPRVVVCGTVTRRAVEATWMTASNAKKDRVGSELKAMIQAPEGYKFVGADVDSQELWIASVLGDSHFGKIHGCTAIGWMMLQGSRADETDMHSKVSNLVGISRDQAKVLNYGRIYGAGKNFAARFLKLSNPQFTIEEARKKANKIYQQTKGKKILMQREDGSTCKKWDGGSESYLFNCLEEIASSKEPRTPVLGCKISTALIPEDVRDSFMTSLVNWVVQSSAVDYLHLMIVAMKWLMDHYSIDGRFSISIHDEVRYLIADRDRYKAALSLQIANLLTRSIFAYKLSMMDLPQSVAFFSRVDIDTVLRKEVDMDCKTPSNPHGLVKGYNIPLGESITIYDLLKVNEIREIIENGHSSQKYEPERTNPFIRGSKSSPRLSL